MNNTIEKQSVEERALVMTCGVPINQLTRLQLIQMVNYLSAERERCLARLNSHGGCDES